MTKKLDAEAIATAVHTLEENARRAALQDIIDELKDWTRASDQTQEEFEAELPGVHRVIGFIEANYIC